MLREHCHPRMWKQVTMTPGMAALATGKNDVRCLSLHLLETAHGGSEAGMRFLQPSISEPTNARISTPDSSIETVEIWIGLSWRTCKEGNLNISQCRKSPGGGSQGMWEILTEELYKKQSQNLSPQHKISASPPHKGTASIGSTQCQITLMNSRWPLHTYCLSFWYLQVIRVHEKNCQRLMSKTLNPRGWSFKKDEMPPSLNSEQPLKSTAVSDRQFLVMQINAISVKKQVLVLIRNYDDQHYNHNCSVENLTLGKPTVCTLSFICPLDRSKYLISTIKRPKLSNNGSQTLEFEYELMTTLKVFWRLIDCSLELCHFLSMPELIHSVYV